MKIENVENLLTNLHDKTEYVIQIRILKQALNHGLVLKKIHRVIEFNQNTWLKAYLDMSAKLGQKAKNNCESDFFKLVNNAVFGKAVEIELVTTERRGNCLVSVSNYHTIKFF